MKASLTSQHLVALKTTHLLTMEVQTIDQVAFKIFFCLNYNRHKAVLFLTARGILEEVVFVFGKKGSFSILRLLLLLPEE